MALIYMDACPVCGAHVEQSGQDDYFISFTCTLCATEEEPEPEVWHWLKPMLTTE